MNGPVNLFGQNLKIQYQKFDLSTKTKEVQWGLDEFNVVQNVNKPKKYFGKISFG